MQIGTRFRAGEEPHHSVPASLHEAISAAESKYESGTVWTLTWLEGLPMCELDDICRVQLLHDGTVKYSDLTTDIDEEEDDDWLR